MATLTFLGTGTSQGVPLIGCKCQVCTSIDPRDNRLRSSVLIQMKGVNLVIDTGPDFRQQMLREGVEKLHSILYTHGHKDHLAGLDDVRAFNFIQQKPIDIYLDQYTEQNMRSEFSYIFAEDPYPGIPQVNLHRLRSGELTTINGIQVLPIEVMHAKLPVLGFRFGNLAYITDANSISDRSMDLLRGVQTLIINALRHEKHISHFTLEEAIIVAKEIGPESTYFTHISHQLGLHSEVSKDLEPSYHLAYDGLRLTFEGYQ